MLPHWFIREGLKTLIENYSPFFDLDLVIESVSDTAISSR